jgi:hypothetical protein
LDAVVQEFNGERMARDVRRLPDQLVQPLLGNDTLSDGIGVAAVIRARGMAIQKDAKSHRPPDYVGTQHRVKIAPGEAILNAAG